jgi:hypothetical protein
MTLERSGSKRSRGRARGPVIAALLLCGATVASATMPQVWKRLQWAATDVTTVEGTTAAKVVPHRAPPGAPPVPSPRPESIWDHTAVSETPAPQPGAAVRKSTSSKSRSVAEPLDALTSGALIVEAIRERRAGNVARARELASEYRTKNPAGALHEEALALCVEASAALGDEEARQLAGLYLQRYPRGRFRAQAQRVVDNAR